MNDSAASLGDFSRGTQPPTGVKTYKAPGAGEAFRNFEHVNECLLFLSEN